jgi:hypothetical protein
MFITLGMVLASFKQALLSPILPWKSKKQVPPKRWYLSTKLHGVTYLKNVVLIMNGDQ